MKNAIPVTASVEPVVKPMHVPHAAGANNEIIPQGLESLVIPYKLTSLWTHSCGTVISVLSPYLE